METCNHVSCFIVSLPSLLHQLLFLIVLTFHIWYRLRSCYLFCLLCYEISTSEHHGKLKDLKLSVSLILKILFSCLIDIVIRKKICCFSLSFVYWFESSFSLHIFCWTIVPSKWISKWRGHGTLKSIVGHHG